MKLIFFIFLILSLTSAATLLGGWNDVDLNSTDYSFELALSTSVQHLRNVQNTNQFLVLSKVIKAKKQLVNGMNYRITLELGHTNCSRNDANDSPEYCTTEKLQKCTVRSYVEWSNQTTIKNFSCDSLKRVKRSLLGGLESSTAEEAKDALKFVVQQLGLQSDGSYGLDLHSVEKVNKQIVAGVKYYATIVLKMKSCRSRALLSACSDKELVEETNQCEVEVVDHPWLTPRYEVIKAECNGANKAGKLKFSPQEVNDKHPLSIRRLKKLRSVEAFKLFKAAHNKVYSGLEEERRMKIFSDNLDRAEFHQNHDLGTAVYGATEFSDLTEEEFRERYLSRVWDGSLSGIMKQAKIPEVKDGDLPKEFDWRNHSAVTGVKNQKSCGSCWAFSVVGNIEGAWSIKHGELIDLSPQELVDCDKLDEGCNGGLPSYAYAEILRLGGLESESDYPYHARDEQCILDKSKIRVYINGSVNISSSEQDMAAWLVNNGPMSIGINALFMQFYMGGISHPWPFLCPKALDHGVVIVGYGVRKGWFRDIPYWIVKNSWGTGWGEHGYYLVHRGSGACGLNLMVSSAVID